MAGFQILGLAGISVHLRCNFQADVLEVGLHWHFQYELILMVPFDGCLESAADVLVVEKRYGNSAFSQSFNCDWAALVKKTCLEQHAGLGSHQEVLLVVDVAHVELILLGRNTHVDNFRKTFRNCYEPDVLVSATVRDNMTTLHVNALVIAPDVKLGNGSTVFLIELNFDSSKRQALEGHYRPAPNDGSTGNAFASEVHYVHRGSILKNLSEGEIHRGFLEGASDNNFLGDASERLYEIETNCIVDVTGGAQVVLFSAEFVDLSSDELDVLYTETQYYLLL